MRIAEIQEDVNVQKVYHSTEWGAEIIESGVIRAGTLKDGRKGVCVTRSFYFAKAFSDVIFVLDLRKIKQRYKVLPRAEAGAYDLANDHGDFRIEAEEFISCQELKLDDYLLEIWIREDVNEPSIRRHPLYRGDYKYV